MPEENNRAIAFSRVSSDEQGDGFSLEAQSELAFKYAKLKRLKIVKNWEERESASKEDLRKAFDEMLDYISKNNIQHAIFDKIDRAVRGLKSAYKIEELIEKHSVKFHFTRENLIIDDRSLPQEKFRFYLGTVMAKYYIDNLKSEIHKGIDQRLKNGYWNGLAPFGYKNIRENGRANLEIDPIESEIVKEIFELYSTGNFTYEMLLEIAKNTLAKNSRENSYTKRLMETVLTNPFYYGIMRVKGILHPGNHVPIITKELFDNCQKIKTFRAKKYKTRDGLIHSKPFMGFLKCGNCGHAITGETIVKRFDKKYNYYRCANNKCSGFRKRVTDSDLFSQLKLAFEPFSKWTPKATEAFIRLIEGQSEKAAIWANDTENKSLEARSELKFRLKKLLDLKNQGLLTEKEFNAASEVPRKILAEAEIDFTQFQNVSSTSMKGVTSVIQMFYKIFQFMEIAGFELEKIRLAKLVLYNCTLEEKIMRFDYRQPLDELFNLTESKNWWKRSDADINLIKQLSNFDKDQLEEILKKSEENN